MAGLVLIVDDEEDIVTTLEYNLTKDGYSTRSALNGKTALELATKEPIPDLILLDLMLPDLSGTEICRQLRAEPKTKDCPIIMLTAKGEEVDRVVGFEVGADDFVVKPFSVRELLLRIRAILRRGQSHLDSEPEKRLRFGMIKVDTAAHRVWINDTEIRFTSLEFRLLVTFIERRGRVQSREVLLDDVWGFDANVTNRTVDTHVKRLREKLGPAGEYIETIRGVGYRLMESPEGDGSF